MLTMDLHMGNWKKMDEDGEFFRRFKNRRYSSDS